MLDLLKAPVIAAQDFFVLAGRALGRRTRTYASAVGKRRPDDITVVVALVQRAAPGTREAVVAATIADLLGANGAGAA